jgi:hypothetical protein
LLLAASSTLPVVYASAVFGGAKQGYHLYAVAAGGNVASGARSAVFGRLK